MKHCSNCRKTIRGGYKLVGVRYYHLKCDIFSESISRTTTATHDLLRKFGHMQVNPSKPLTFSEAWDSTTDQQDRYSLRVKLLKLQAEDELH
ncbi:hypothetical protein LCGC14_0591230 [marine sediment metagenome]|uniref:Uncharacterized protein n=1 Tax=marine sediment metagenome TaxID=412755 RepID=A0A0F9TZI0_9ZZZZ